MTKKNTSKHQNRLDQWHYNFFIFFAIIAIIKYYFFDEKTIHQTFKYNLLIIWLPTILGVVFLGLYRRKLISIALKCKDSVIQKVSYLGFLLLIGLMTSYISFHTITDFAFQVLTKRKIAATTPIILTVPIHSFSKSAGEDSSYKIWFLFKGQIEFLNTNWKTIEPLKNNHTNYLIHLDIKEGFWDQYIITDWFLIKNDKDDYVPN